jgi:hypothetical protein
MRFPFSHYHAVFPSLLVRNAGLIALKNKKEPSSIKTVLANNLFSFSPHLNPLPFVRWHATPFPNAPG